MKAVVTGASGFIGTQLCERLRENGWIVTAVTRRPSHVTADTVIPIKEDLATVSWHPIVKGADAVFHLAAHVHVPRTSRTFKREIFERVNVRATIRLADAATAADVQRFVFLSTAGVHGDTSDRPLREADPIRPVNLYADSKAKAERELRARTGGISLTIFRPPLVYGSDAPSSFGALLRAVAAGLPMPFGAVDNLRSFVYVGNLVDAMLRSAQSKTAIAEVFLVHDIDLATRDLIIALASGMSKRARLIRISAPWLRAGERLPLVGRKLRALIRSFQLDSSKLRSVLGWLPPHDPLTALQRTAAKFVERSA